MPGTWQQPTRAPGARRLGMVIAGRNVRVTDEAPQVPERTWSTDLEDVHVNAQAQFEAMGHAPHGGERRYLFWPASKDVVWVAYSNEGSSNVLGWTKLKRTR